MKMPRRAVVSELAVRYRCTCAPEHNDEIVSRFIDGEKAHARLLSLRWVCIAILLLRCMHMARCLEVVIFNPATRCSEAPPPSPTMLKPGSRTAICAESRAGVCQLHGRRRFQASRGAEPAQLPLGVQQGPCTPRSHLVRGQLHEVVKDSADEQHREGVALGKV